MLPSSHPFGVIEVGILELLLDLIQEVPTGSAIGNVVAGRGALVLAGVKLADDSSLTIFHMPHKRARIPFSSEGIGRLVARIVYGELLGHVASRVESEGFQAGVSSDSKVGGVAIFADDEATLSLAVKFGRDGEFLLRGTAKDPKSPPFRILERGRTTQRIEHLRELQRSIFGS